MRFYLGTHRPSWLGHVGVPLFVSHRTLRDYKTLPVARGPWSLDSGGFTELSTYGDWCSTGNVDTRLGRVLGVLGIIDPLDAR